MKIVVTPSTKRWKGPCVLVGTPKLLSVGVAAAGHKTMQYATTVEGLEVS